MPSTSYQARVPITTGMAPSGVHCPWSRTPQTTRRSGARRRSSSNTASGVSVAERPAKLSKYQSPGSVGLWSTAYDTRSRSWP